MRYRDEDQEEGYGDDQVESKRWEDMVVVHVFVQAKIRWMEVLGLWLNEDNEEEDGGNFVL